MTTETKQHDLDVIYCGGTDDETEVVRWCRICGAIVVDVEIDGRVAPGAVRKMEVPAMTLFSHCRAKS